MDIQKKSILSQNYLLDDKYIILFFIKKSRNAETYRVRGVDNKLYFLKLFNYSNLHASSFDTENNILEIEILKSIQHNNISSYKDSGELFFENRRFAYLILDFIVGETLAEKILRENTLTIYDLKSIFSDVLKGLAYLHDLNDPVIHNEITLNNIMIDLSGNTPKAKIIDFGYARYFHRPTKEFLRDGLNLNFLASECFKNIYSPQSDLFSVGALIYNILYGNPPWYNEISQFRINEKNAEECILNERKKNLSFDNVSQEIVDFDRSIIKVVNKALQINTEDRFQSADDFLKALNGGVEVDDFSNVSEAVTGDFKERKITINKGSGMGFDAIAGLDDLKAEMRKSVIDILQNPEKAAQYGAKIPNGMILYGPPGCGKTFFAKHFAEEVGFNFILTTPSTLKSKYVNASQENIAKMFEEAEKSAPTIIFIDEINELLPNRDSDSHEMSKSAVNEMLAQMDRTGEKGIFIVGATNYPDMIDPAMLRSGRLEKKFYLPPPDSKLRTSLFQMSLNKRKKKLDFGIDYDKLSTLTENFVSADIESIVNDASAIAMSEDTRITMQLLEKVIGNFKPFSKEELKKYENIRAKINGEKIDNYIERQRIGFKP